MEKKTMKKTLAKLLCLVLAATMLVPCFASCGKKKYTKKNENIVIGLSGPLSGDAAAYGIAVRNSAQMAVDEINAKGGIDGMKFELKMLDDKHDATKIENNFYKMFEGGMQISLGTVTTKPGLEFKELATENEVFCLTPSATGDDIPGDTTYQMCFADSNQGAESAKIFNEKYAGKKIGVFYKADDEYSTGILAKFEKTLSADLKAGLVKASFKGTESDFNTQVQTLKECDVIFMPIYYTPASQFMVAGKGVIKNNAVYYGCDGLDGIDNIDGFDVSTIPQEISYLSHFVSTATTGAAADFIKKYNDKYDENKEPLNQFGAAAYDCVYAIYEALKFAKKNGAKFDETTPASEYCEILTEVFNDKDFVFHGITGAPTSSGKSNISWKADGTVNKTPVSYKVK